MFSEALQVSRKTKNCLLNDWLYSRKRKGKEHDDTKLRSEKYKEYKNIYHNLIKRQKTLFYKGKPSDASNIAENWQIAKDILEKWSK